MQTSIKSSVLVFIVMITCLLIYMHIVIELKTCEDKNIVRSNETVVNVKHVEAIVEDYMKKKHKYKQRSEIIEDMRYSAVEGFIGGMFLSKNIGDSLISSIAYALMGGFTSTYKMYKDINHVKN